MKININISYFVICITLLIGCAHSTEPKIHSDPLEVLNRKIYNFNFNVLDKFLVRPVAVAWRNYIPQPIRNGLSNLTNNLEEPAVMVNYLLYGNIYKSMVHFTRFFLNTLFGIGGLIDIAGMTNEKLQREQSYRFGSTLGHYGIGYGPYIQLPFYGSFTLREDIGNMVDTIYPLLSLLSWQLSIGKWTLEKIEARAQMLDYDNIVYQSYDPYIVMREAYFQNHDFIAKSNNYNSNKKLHQYYPNVKAINNALSKIDAE